MYEYSGKRGSDEGTTTEVKFGIARRNKNTAGEGKYKVECPKHACAYRIVHVLIYLW